MSTRLLSENGVVTETLALRLFTVVASRVCFVALGDVRAALGGVLSPPKSTEGGFVQLPR